MKTVRKKSIRLYNVLFPIWFFMFLPFMWLIIIPVNILWDAFILRIATKKIGLTDIKQIVKAHLLKVVLVGFGADLLTAGLLLLSVELIPTNTHAFWRWMSDGLATVYEKPFSFIAMLPFIALAGAIIYFLNKKWSFSKAAWTEAEKHKVSLYLAVLTAPYTFMLPIKLIYSGL